MSKPVILTGIRSNNDLHLGNYLGALLPMVDLQKKYAGDYQVNLFVPDLHSFTTPIDHSQLYDQTMHNLKLFVAAGLNLHDDNTYIYRQSCVSAHSELAIILNSFTYMGELKRMTQFKDKSEQQDNVSVGLFDYPVLMAADILLYGAKFVPVGADQTQHVELARDIAIRLNNKFEDDLFALPEAEKAQIAFVSQNDRPRVRDLQKPEKKMSKSADSNKGVIFLGDKPADAAQKIMSATTDSIGMINYDMQEQPGISNLLEMLSALTNQSLEDVIKVFQGQTQYGPIKEAVAKAASDFLINFQAKLAAVDDQALQAKLEASEKAMNTVANATLHKVQLAVGLRNNDR
jgi:tryptophanyl-tRNA synthetase